MDKSERKVIDDIDRCGWHVVKVMEDQEHPPHAFSIGLYKTFRHPEIIIVGLKLEMMHNVINSIGADVKDGKVYESGKYYPGLLEKFDCWFNNVPCSLYEDYVGYAVWYYKQSSFPLLQCVWPTTQGIYPWELSYPRDLIQRQPVLGEPFII